MLPADKMAIRFIKSSRLYDLLRLKGYVAFDLPRTVAALGAVLLTCVGAEHLYVMITGLKLPIYFDVYSVVVAVVCLTIAGALCFGAKPRVSQSAWFLGDLFSVLFIGLYLVSRLVSLPGLVAVTGRWDVVPATLAAAFAAGFVAVHISVLLDINIAYPQQRNWTQ